MEDNKLLAEYLGLTIHDYGANGQGGYTRSAYYKGPSIMFDVDQWRPHKSWDQLMLVVEKIMKDYNSPIKFQLYSKGGPIIGASFKQFDGSYICKETGDPINSTYNACVEYIQIINDKS